MSDGFSNFTVLLVEDDPDHAEMSLRLLKSFKLFKNIRLVTDGKEALAYLYHEGPYQDLHSAPKPDLVFLDLRLPYFDGLEILKRMRAEDELKDLPVVVLSSSVNETDMIKAYESSISSYLIKPLSMHEISRILRSFGVYGRYWAELDSQKEDAGHE